MGPPVAAAGRAVPRQYVLKLAGRWMGTGVSGKDDEERERGKVGCGKVVVALVYL